MDPFYTYCKNFGGLLIQNEHGEHVFDSTKGGDMLHVVLPPHSVMVLKVSCCPSWCPVQCQGPVKHTQITWETQHQLLL